MFELDAVNINNKDLAHLGNIFNSIFFKLFRTFDKEIILQYQYYCGYLPFCFSFDSRKLSFLNNIRPGPDSAVKFLLRWVGKTEFHRILTSYNIDRSASICNFNNAMWQCFINRIEAKL